MTVGVVWRAGEFSGTGVVVMGSVGVTMLHPRRPGDPELPPPPVPKVALSSLEDASRVVYKDGDLLCTIPTNTALESYSWGERLRRPG
jgi:hypothetical protein